MEIPTEVRIAFEALKQDYADLIRLMLRQVLCFVRRVKFLSYNNVVGVLSSHPLVTLAFILLFLANLLVAYVQITLLFLGAHNLLTQDKRTLLKFTKKTIADSLLILKQARPSKILFVLLYIALLFHFLRKILKIYYLNKILVPNFILTYLKETYFWGAVVLPLLVWLMLLIAVKLMFALPKIFFENSSVREAVRFSLEKTKKRTFFYSWQLFWIVTKTFLFFLEWLFLSFFYSMLQTVIPIKWQRLLV